MSKNLDADFSASKNTVVSKALIEQGQGSYYSTELGDAFLGDSKELLKLIPESSVSLVVTSPPFALRRKKNYGNEDAENYVNWFRPFAEQVKRILKPDGSFVIEIGGAWMPGHPVRSIYHYELLIAGLSLKNMSKSEIGQVHWGDDNIPHNPGSHRRCAVVDIRIA